MPSLRCQIPSLSLESQYKRDLNTIPAKVPIMTAEIHPGAIASLLSGDHGAPFLLLGPHPAGEGTLSIRAFRPDAAALTVVIDQTGARHPMARLDAGGFFAVTLPDAPPDLAYHYELTPTAGETVTLADPYAYPSQITDYDLYLFNEGRHLEIYEKLGAHLIEVSGVKGVLFAVWAPNAYRVSVIGDFNGWDARIHSMREHALSGVWELFIPGLGEGTAYKFDLRSRFNSYHAEKTDPFGFYSEQRPRTASLVADLDRYEWHDEVWMQARRTGNALAAPMSIYEVHLGSWRRKHDDAWLTYRDLAEELVQYAKEMHYTHLELMPVAEHPLDASWGYQITGYFSATSRYGSPTDLMYFIDVCHQNGIGVILDWVPAHFPKDGHGLSYFDGTHLYEHADPRKGEHPDWGTYIFNYGRNEVRNFLLSNALFWLRKYHIDGLRVDAVSSMLYLDFGRKDGEWLPNEYGGRENLEAVQFLQEANAVIHQAFPGAVTIAEESTAWPMVSRPTYLGGLGFTLKWNMGWMHDTLQYISENPLYRRYHHHKLTFSLMYAFSENFVLSLSHDEVVHGKGSLIGKIAGDWWQKFATLRLLFGYQYTHPGKKLHFMGQEFGQWREWSEERSLDWHLLELDTHRTLQAWMRDLNAFYRSQPALYEVDFGPEGFCWIEANDSEQSVFTYLRQAKDPRDFVIVACNFTPVPRADYRIGVPEPGYYREMLNSDAAAYGGGNIGNLGGRHSDPIPWHAWPQSLSLTLPPLAIVILKLERQPADVPLLPASAASGSASAGTGSAS
ncbi:MAG: 1,4-alpha-glucan branching protein GlgB [Chloroflexi bacterium]|nr:1,4-alpha-glucan branching protein GlgB [Chloroflexota bacterium]